MKKVACKFLGKFIKSLSFSNTTWIIFFKRLILITQKTVHENNWQNFQIKI